MKNPISVTLRLLGTLVLLSLLALPVAAGLRPDARPRPDPIADETCWTFIGEVHDDACYYPTICPLAGVELELIGTNTGWPNQRGTRLASATTLADGSYTLTTCDNTWEYYQVQLTVPEGCTTAGNGTPPTGGAAWTSTMIEYSRPLEGRNTTHDRFWLSCEEPTPTPTPTATPQCWRLQGKVFDADYPGETRPLPGIGLSLVVCNDPYPASGSVLMTTTTNISGWYGLDICDGPVTFDWYRIQLQVPAGWQAVNATSVDGDVKANKQVIEFTWPLSTQNLTGNKFWIRPLQGPTPTPTPTVRPVEPCEHILPHGSFEGGILPPWYVIGVAQVSNQYGHDGSKSVLLTDVNNTFGELVAEIDLPPTAASLTLRYWWLAVSQDPDPNDDFMNVVIEWPGGIDHLGHHEHWENPGYWNLVEIDLLPHAGRHVFLTFHGHNGPSYPSSWFVDHVEIEFCPAGGGEIRLFLPLILKAAV